MASVVMSDESIIDDETEAKELEKLLSAFNEIEAEDPIKQAVAIVAETNTFGQPLASASSNSKQVNSQATYQNEELDSSDEEELNNFIERKYNQYGRDINQTLKQQQAEKLDASISKYVNSSFSTALKNSTNEHQNSENRLSQTFKAKPVASPLPIKKPEPLPTSCFTDPVFGLRIIQPLISGAFLKERMEGRTAVSMSSITTHIHYGDLSKDWVVAGVIVSKSLTKQTKKGDPFSIWKISDLKGEIKTLSLFLFRTAHKDLWKTPQGVVIAILNAGVMDKRKENSDVACLSIDTAQKVMILGTSKDLGTCKSRKKNGEPCTAVVNSTDCEYCIYHVKQEFNMMSKRSELQSSTAGRGLHDLRNKILGKSEVFYGGKSYTAIPAKKSAKQSARDENRLMTLSEYYQSPNASSNNIVNTRTPKTPSYELRAGPISKVATTVELTAKQRQKDLERLKLLKGPADDTSSCNETSSPITQANVPEKYKNREFSFTQFTPSLSQTDLTLELDLGKRKANLAKTKAIATIKKKPIQKTDPNLIKYRGTAQGKKRAIDLMNEDVDSEAKRRKFEENERKTRIQRIIEATSSHTNLIKSRDDEEREKYFNKMEKKEALEEKMLSTFKIACKAVICKQCKYTALSAHDRCKEERHTLKVIDTEKRFFECQDCGNRTVTVHKIPKISCKNCLGSRWKRAAMIREKKTKQGAELSIRGNEEKFIGSLVGSANLNLLVPIED